MPPRIGDRKHDRPLACCVRQARLTPESIKLTRIQFRRTSDGMIARINGRATASKTTLQTELQQFIGSLKESPLFHEVVLTNVAGDSFGSSSQRFDAAFALIAPAAEQDDAAVASADGGSRP